jgi:hypothetical protein
MSPRAQPREAGRAVAAPRISRPAPSEHPVSYLEDLLALSADDAWPLLESQPAEVARLFDGLPEARALHRYAANKWSAKEVLGHLCDNERVFAYRALRFARGDETPLANFDEDLYVANAGFDERPTARLVEEFRVVREATISLVATFDDETLGRIGVARGARFSVRGIVWLTIGHVRHHLDVLRERYGIG